MRDIDASIVVADGRHVPGWLVLRASPWPDEAAGEHAAAVDLSLARSGDRICFVALAHDQVVGFAEASIRHEYVNGCEAVPVAFLEGLFVTEGHRRCGLARTLCAAVEDWGRAQGMGELGSDAEAGNADGLAFHAGAGFTETERVVFFRKPLQQAGGQAGGGAVHVIECTGYLSQPGRKALRCAGRGWFR